MNNPLSISNGQGLLKSVYKGKGPVSQMNDNHAMIHVLRKKRDLIGKTQTMGK